MHQNKRMGVNKSRETYTNLGWSGKPSRARVDKLCCKG